MCYLAYDTLFLFYQTEQIESIFAGCSDMSKPFIELHNLTKQFKEGVQERFVLTDISHGFMRGEFIVLLGSSGSGKSTLLNLISGIEEPTSGYVTIAGHNITAMRDRERTVFRRDHIGFVFQFFNLIPTLTVLENITLPMELAGKKRQHLEKLGRSILGRVGLGNREQTFPDKLSGGEQQRVAVARALVHDPLVVLADEPTGNLDETTGEKVLNLLLELTRDAGKTLIMATHSPAIVPFADRVYRIHNAQLLQTYVELEGHILPPSE